MRVVAHTDAIRRNCRRELPPPLADRRRRRRDPPPPPCSGSAAGIRLRRNPSEEAAMAFTPTRGRQWTLWTVAGSLAAAFFALWAHQSSSGSSAYSNGTTEDEELPELLPVAVEEGTAKRERELQLKASSLCAEFYCLVLDSAMFRDDAYSHHSIIKKLTAIPVACFGGSSFTTSPGFFVTSGGNLSSGGMISSSFTQSAGSLAFPSSSNRSDGSDQSSTAGSSSHMHLVLNLNEAVNASTDATGANTSGFDAAVDRMRQIASCEILPGFGAHLRGLFITLRRGILRRRCAELSRDTIAFKEVRWIAISDLEFKIVQRVLALHVFVRFALAEERHLCDEVLASAPERLREECFAEVAMASSRSMLSFFNLVTTLQRRPENLLHVVGMYELLNSVTSQLVSLFSGENRLELDAMARKLLRELADAVSDILDELARLILADVSTSFTAGGGVHRLTHYVMNYIDLLVQHRDTLNILLRDSSSGISAPKLTPFGRRVLQLIQSLETNLEQNAAMCEDAGVQSLFLAVDGRQAGDERRRMRRALKYRLKCFNEKFAVVLAVQGPWKVIDPAVRQKLRQALSDKVVPVYTAFLAQFESCLHGERNADQHIQYSADVMEQLLLQLFEG